MKQLNLVPISGKLSYLLPPLTRQQLLEPQLHLLPLLPTCCTMPSDTEGDSTAQTLRIRTEAAESLRKAAQNLREESDRVESDARKQTDKLQSEARKLETMASQLLDSQAGEPPASTTATSEAASAPSRGPQSGTDGSVSGARRDTKEEKDPFAGETWDTHFNGLRVGKNEKRLMESRGGGYN